MRYCLLPWLPRLRWVVDVAIPPVRYPASSDLVFIRYWVNLGPGPAELKSASLKILVRAARPKESRIAKLVRRATKQPDPDDESPFKIRLIAPEEGEKWKATDETATVYSEKERGVEATAGKEYLYVKANYSKITGYEMEQAPYLTVNGITTDTLTVTCNPGGGDGASAVFSGVAEAPFPDIGCSSRVLAARLSRRRALRASGRRAFRDQARAPSQHRLPVRTHEAMARDEDVRRF